MVRTRRWAIVGVLALAVSAVAATAATADRGEKVRVCHHNPGEASPVVLELPSSAVPTHVGVHDGDGVIGVDVDEDCAPIEAPPPGSAPALARASSTAADGEDVLVAQLEDTNADGVVSVGDVVVTGAVPLGFDGTAYSQFTVTRHVVDRVDLVTSTEVRVQVGSATFEWNTDHDGSGTELYEERGATGTVLADGRGDALPFDLLFVSSTSPSAPGDDVVQGVESPADDGFLGVWIAGS